MDIFYIKVGLVIFNEWYCTDIDDIYCLCLLPVSETNDIPENETFTGDNSAVSISVPILVVLILAVAVLLALLMKRRHGAKPVNSFSLYILCFVDLFF